MGVSTWSPKSSLPCWLFLLHTRRFRLLAPRVSLASRSATRGHGSSTSTRQDSSPATGTSSRPSRSTAASAPFPASSAWSEAAQAEPSHQRWLRLLRAVRRGGSSGGLRGPRRHPRLDPRCNKSCKSVPRGPPPRGEPCATRSPRSDPLPRRRELGLLGGGQPGRSPQSKRSWRRHLKVVADVKIVREARHVFTLGKTVEDLRPGLGRVAQSSHVTQKNPPHGHRQTQDPPESPHPEPGTAPSAARLLPDTPASRLGSTAPVGRSSGRRGAGVLVRVRLECRCAVRGAEVVRGALVLDVRGRRGRVHPHAAHGICRLL